MTTQVVPRELLILKKATRHYIQVLETVLPAVEELGRTGNLDLLVRLARRPGISGSPASIGTEVARLLGEA